MKVPPFCFWQSPACWLPALPPATNECRLPDEVQVTDTINAYFVRVRLDKDGQTKVGYMDRRCFGERGSERGNRKNK